MMNSFVSDAGNSNYGHSVGKRLGESIEKGDGLGAVSAVLDGIAAGLNISARSRAFGALDGWRGLFFPASQQTGSIMGPTCYFAGASGGGIEPTLQQLTARQETQYNNQDILDRLS